MEKEVEAVVVAEGSCPQCGGMLIKTDLQKRGLHNKLQRVWRCQNTHICGWEELR